MFFSLGAVMILYQNVGGKLYVLLSCLPSYS